MRVTYNNFLTPGAATITAFSTATGYLPSNVAHPHKTKLYASAYTGAQDEYLIFDFGAAITIDAIGIINQSGMDQFAWTYDANSSNSWGSPAYTLANGENTQGFVGTNQIDYLGANRTYRWWRFLYQKLTGWPQIFVGGFQFCKLATLPTPSYAGYSVSTTDPSRISKSAGGQTFAEKLPKFREFDFEWDNISATEMATMQTFVNSVGTSDPFLCKVMLTGSELTETLYLRLKKTPNFQVVGFDSTLRYSASMSAEEML
jgi:hypothetical protein